MIKTTTPNFEIIARCNKFIKKEKFLCSGINDCQNVLKFQQIQFVFLLNTVQNLIKNRIQV